jgi:hypothetical protein
MGQILELASTPEWWLSAVLLNIIINIGSAYIKPMLDKALAGIKGSRGERARKRREEHDRRVEDLVRHAVLLAQRHHSATQGLVVTLVLYVLALLALACAGVVDGLREGAGLPRWVLVPPYIVALLSLGAGTYFFNMAVRWRDETWGATKRLLRLQVTDPNPATR